MKIGEVYEAARKKVQSAIESSNSDLKLPELINVCISANQIAIEEVYFQIVSYVRFVQ